MEKSFKSIIDQSNSVLILLPTNPTFDEVAAALSLYLSLEGKKDVAVSCPTKMVVEHNRLVGVDKIGEEVGSKNLVLKLSGYPPDKIEKVTYDIEGQQFRLSIIPKAQMEPPKKEQLEVSYSGVSADTTFLIGGQKQEQFPSLSQEELSSTKLIHIGVLDIHFADTLKVISLSRPSSSICELMSEYVKEIEGGFHPDIASNLLSGMHEGSGNFSGKNVSANTFKLAGELMSAGGKYTKKEEFKPQMAPGGSFSIPGMGMMPMPFPPKAAAGAAKLDDISPEEDSSEAPEGETVQNPPPSWLKSPKIYKGTSVS